MDQFKNNFICYGPVLKRNSISNECKLPQFPVPDGNRIGPVFLPAVSALQPITHPEYLNSFTKSRGKNGTASFSSVGMFTYKNMRGKCPIERIGPSLLPVERKHVTDNNLLSSSYYKETITSDGSCLRKNLLTTFSNAEANYIIYPQNKNGKTKVFLSSVDEENTIYRITKKEIFSNHKDPVVRLEAANLFNDSFLLVCNPKTLTLFSINTKEPLCDYNCHLLISDSSMSSQTPGLFSVLDETGNLFLFSAAYKEQLWNVKVNSLVKYNSYFTTAFSPYQPTSVLASYEKVLWLHDYRTPGQSRCIMDISQESNLYTNTQDKICSFSSSQHLPYVYVNCLENVFLIDIRYCHSPVVTYNHMMLDEPIMSVMHTKGKQEILLLSDNIRKSVCVIGTDYYNYSAINNVLPNGVCLPRHFLYMDDAVSFAHQHDTWFNHKVLQRLNSPIAGMATLKTSNAYSDFTIFLNNNKGDLFYQTYKFRVEDNSNTGASQKNTNVNIGHCVSNVNYKVEKKGQTNCSLKENTSTQPQTQITCPDEDSYLIKFKLYESKVSLPRDFFKDKDVQYMSMDIDKLPYSGKQSPVFNFNLNRFMNSNKKRFTKIPLYNQQYKCDSDFTPHHNTNKVDACFSKSFRDFLNEGYTLSNDVMTKKILSVWQEDTKYLINSKLRMKVKEKPGNGFYYGRNPVNLEDFAIPNVREEEIQYRVKKALDKASKPSTVDEILRQKAQNEKEKLITNNSSDSDDDLDAIINEYHVKKALKAKKTISKANKHLDNNQQTATDVCQTVPDDNITHIQHTNSALQSSNCSLQMSKICTSTTNTTHKKTTKKIRLDGF